MSQIFDALLRSEVERSGSESATLPDATQLLRNTEQQVSSRWGSVPLVNGRDGAAPERPEVLLQEVSFREAEPFEAKAGTLYEDHPAIWGQFRTRTVSSSPESRLVSLSANATPMAEAFRLLGVRLRDLRQTRSLKKLLLTSTVPQEGKSTVAANLACTLGHKSGERVLLLEGDVWRPSLSAMFNLADLPGMGDWLAGDRHLTEIIYQLEGAGIWMLPAGTAPATPLGLLQAQKLTALLDQLGDLFDWVIVDSPPILPLADTSIWTRIVDGILLVARPGVTEKRQLEKGIQALDPGKLLGALLNCSKLSTYKSYYYNPNPSADTANSWSRPGKWALICMDNNRE
jgi:capsular exopolysaccharide synthesis family protein